MRKAEHIFLIVAAAAICFSALAYNVAGLLFPHAVEVAEVSNLENRYYAAAPELAFESVQQKTFQDGLDRFIADHVPLRDAVVMLNATLQRASIASGAAICAFNVYPTFFGSHYYAVPRDGLIVDRAEEAPADGGGRVLDAWVNTLNEAAATHPETRFVYDCVVRHDQTEFNPTYRYFPNRIDESWARANILDRLDARILAFTDPVRSYDEIKGEWFATDNHWTLERALKSYDLIADRLSLERFPYEGAVQVVREWHGSYARSGLDLDYPLSMSDVPLDFSHLAYRDLDEFGGGERNMGARDDVLAGNVALENDLASKYYEYYGGGDVEIENSAREDGKTMLLVCDSLSYCLLRYLASNYEHTVVLMPGNSRLEGSFESYLNHYRPDDVIVLLHASKYQTFEEYSPAFIGL